MKPRAAVPLAAFQRLLWGCGRIALRVDQQRGVSVDDDVKAMTRWRRGLELDWAFDLVAVDVDVRSRALQRHEATKEACWAAQQQVDSLAAEAGTPRPVEPHLAARMDQLHAAVADANQYLLMSVVADWTSVHTFREDEEGLRFVLLYLLWEANYPGEWEKSWRTKNTVLRRLGHLAEYPTPLRDQLRSLVMGAVSRAHRCEDQGYVHVARAVTDPDLRAALERARGQADRSGAARRAAFMLFMLDRPSLAVTRHVWRRWLSTYDDADDV
jgi:hypothetical protein